MRTCVLHMGLPKTGTTSFQNALFNQHDYLLSERGILYPSIEPNHTNPLCAMFLPDPRTLITIKLMGLKTKEEAEDLRRSYMRRMEQEIESTEWTTLVMSAEGLSNCPPQSLIALREWLSKYVDNWKIIYWSRHPVSYTTSLMQQLIKGGHTIEEMVEKFPMTKFKFRIGRAIEIFGRSTVELTAFEDARSQPGGLVAAFCRCVGLDEEATSRVTKAAHFENESMSMLATHVLNGLNKHRPLFVDGQVNPSRSGNELRWVSHLKGRKFELSPEIKDQVRTTSRQDVRWLNETFGTSLYLDVFDDLPEQEQSTDRYPRAVAERIGVAAFDLANLWRNAKTSIAVKS